MKTFFLALGLTTFTLGVLGAFVFTISSNADDQRVGSAFHPVVVAGAVLAAGGLLAPRTTTTSPPAAPPPHAYGGPPPPYRR